MKNKKLLALLIGLLALSGCGPEPTVEPTPEPKPTEPAKPSEPAQPSTPAQPSSPADSTPAPSVPVTPSVNHQDPFVSAAEGAVTREFKAEFDTMVDDFSGETLLGTNTNGVVQKDVLRVLVDSANGDFPSSPDGAIYKMATGNYDIDKYEGIGFRIRKVGEGTLDLSNLVLGLRGGDAYKVYELNLADAVNPDGEALEELSDEFVDLVISPNLSLEDDQTVYENPDGTPSELKVLEEILGFHLYAKDEVSQVIEIEEVFLTQAGEKTTLDNFNRANVGAGDPSVWWRGSTGFIVQNGIKLNGGASYQTAAFENPAANVVLSLLGDASGLSIAPVTAAGVGTPVPFASLKDQNNAPVVSPVNGAFHNFVINFANSGISTEGLVGLVISSTSEVNVAKIFLTDLVDKAAVTEYPIIDSENIAMFDNFNRTQSGFDGDYDKSSTNPVVTGAGLNYALSYNNGDKVSVANGVVTFDATELAEDQYINFKEGRAVYDNHQYLVMAVKGEGGATLDGFRIDVGNGAVWSHSWYSAFGLKVPALGAANYPYTTEDGFQWLIIDLEESGMDPAAKTDQAIDMYYSGTGKLMIDSMFYADLPGVRVAMEEVEFVTDKVVEDQTGYNYIAGYDNTTGKLLKLELSSTAGTTLAGFRVEIAGDVKWFKDGALKDAEGNVISGDTAVTAEGLTVVIDLEESGFATLVGGLHIHNGLEGVTGDVKVSASVIQPKAQAPQYEEVAFVSAKVVESQATYSYVGGYDNNGEKLLKLELSSTAGTTLGSIRVELAGETKWIKDGALKDAEGNVISGDTAVTAEGLTVVIDLEASGYASLVGGLHIHVGDLAGVEGDLTITAKALKPVVEGPKYEETTFVSDKVIESQATYSYVGGYDNNGEKLLKLELSSTAGTTLGSIRVELAGETKWIKDGALKDAEGNVISGDTAVTAEGLTVVIDLEASGYASLVGGLHIHVGDLAGVEGDLTIKATAMKEIVEGPQVVETEFVSDKVIESQATYSYVGGYDNNGEKLLKLELSSTAGTTLGSIRVELAGETKWIKDGALKDAEGNVISGDTAVTAEGLTVVIDLEASGYASLVGGLHIHVGDLAGVEGDLTITAIAVEVVEDNSAYEDVMNGLVQ